MPFSNLPRGAATRHAHTPPLGELRDQAFTRRIPNPGTTIPVPDPVEGPTGSPLRPGTGARVQLPLRASVSSTVKVLNHTCVQMPGPRRRVVAA